MNDLYLIYSACKETWGVDLKKKKRTRPYPYARACYYKIAKTQTKKGIVEIGSFLNKDHATVLHGLKIFEDYELVPEFKEQYNKCLDFYHSLKEETFSVSHTEQTIEYVTEKVVHKYKGFEGKINELERKNQSLTDTVLKLKNTTSSPDWLQPILNLPEDVKEELINTRIKPFLTMLKSRQTYETIKHI